MRTLGEEAVEACGELASMSNSSLAGRVGLAAPEAVAASRTAAPTAAERLLRERWGRKRKKKKWTWWLEKKEENEEEKEEK